MSEKQLKPMLAATLEDTSNLQWPVLCSKKLDGIRCLIVNGVVYSRSMKKIRSKTVQELFGKTELNGIDAEILYGDWSDKLVFNKTTSAAMATELKPEFSRDEIRLAVFDYFDSEEDYAARNQLAGNIVREYGSQHVVHLEQTIVRNEQELLEYEANVLELGFEGVMCRSVTGAYKMGRSTLKEGIISKLKRFDQDEGLIIGFEEKFTNTNEAKTNELGRTQRSQALEGMVGADTLGALVCTCQGITFTCGSGLDDAMRAEVWANKDKYVGKYITFTHFAVGRKDSFRFPIFKGFRDAEDMS